MMQTRTLRRWAVAVLCALVWPATAPEDAATFELELSTPWSRDATPFEFPDDAHLSSLAGATHHRRYTLFRDGATASSGLELVAENGRAGVLHAELAEALRRERLGAVIDGPTLARVPGTMRTTFATTRRHPLLSFVTMLAPSPDWFIGAADVPLITGERWIDTATVTL